MHNKFDKKIGKKLLVKNPKIEDFTCEHQLIGTRHHRKLWAQRKTTIEEDYLKKIQEQDITGMESYMKITSQKNNFQEESLTVRWHQLVYLTNLVLNLAQLSPSLSLCFIFFCRLFELNICNAILCLAIMGYFWPF